MFFGVNVEKKWYIINTVGGQEVKAKTSILEQVKLKNLENEFGDILIPSERVVEVSRGKKKEKDRTFFPGYIFIQMHLTETSWHVVKNTPKVGGFVGKGKPQAVPEDQVLKVTKQIQDGAKSVSVAVTFSVGESISIIDGPFNGFDAVVEEVSEDKMKLKVTVGIFGRPTSVELNFTQVKNLI